MPAADDLFRPTADGSTAKKKAAVRAVPDAPESADASAAEIVKRPSGRVRHDEKITVYVTAAELMAAEHARLKLRGEHGLVVDRGRLVREALGMVLADFETQGEDSALVRRLRE